MTDQLSLVSVLVTACDDSLIERKGNGEGGEGGGGGGGLKVVEGGGERPVSWDWRTVLIDTTL